MNSEELSESAADAIDLGEALSRAENAKDETVVRGLYIVAASISALAAAAYEIAAALKEKA